MDIIPCTPGIYKIICFSTGKIYIGSTQNLKKRWNEHRRKLRAGNHQNVYLQRAWNKHGENAFVFEVIELVTPWSLLDREQYWLDTVQPYDRKIGFNIAHHADTPVRTPEIIEKLRTASSGKSMSTETREKLRIINTGKHHTTESRAKMSSARMGISYSEETRNKMSAAKRGKKQPPEMIANRIVSLHKMKRSPEHIAALTESRSKRFVIIAPDGTEYRIKGLTQFCKDHDLIRSKMSAVATGKNIQHRGWKCRYDKDGI